MHLAPARRYFGLSQANFDLVAADARQWLAAGGTERFDLVIDDLFGDHGGVPRRAIEADGPWLDALARRVGPRGALAVNFADPGRVSPLGPEQAPTCGAALRERIHHAAVGARERGRGADT
ncbi:MAG: hypothetical protein M5U09_05200 [Gammaproteobacteria bacterium]|nr:hypothetical protein [Gammaproteobacteria bacterium]